MRTAVLLTITVICVWALAPYFPAPADIFNPSPSSENHPPKEGLPSLTFEDIEQQVFSLINEQRKAEGLLILTWDRKLEGKAQEHSELMVITQNYEHSDENVFENLYWGINVSPARLAKSCFDAWIESNRHKSNILEPSIKYGAVGIAGDGTSTFVTFMAK